MACENRRLASWARHVGLCIAGLGVALAACSSEPTSGESLGSSSQALTSSQQRILGFESVGSGSSDWTSSAGTLTQSTRHVEGASSLAIANGGNAEIKSAALSSLGPVADKLSLDLLLPAVQPNPNWMGTLKIVIECPSQQLSYEGLAEYQLQGRATEQFLRFEFPLSASTRSKLSTGTYSDLRFKILLNVASGAGPWLLDRLSIGDASSAGGAAGSSGAGSGGTGGGAGANNAGAGGASAGSAGASAREVTFRIVTPIGVAPSDVALAAANTIRINDGVSLVLANGTGHSSAASAGNPGSSYVGVQSWLQNLWSIGNVDLRNNSKVFGNLTTSGTVSFQPGATILGTRTEQATLTPRSTVSWKVSFPLPNAGPVSLDPNVVRVLDPGNYGQLAVKAGAHLKLRRGTYRFEEGTIEPHGYIDIDNTTGPVFIYFRSGLIFNGVTNPQSGTDNVLFGVGNLVNQIGSPWRGVLVANGSASLISAQSVGHDGSIFADDIILHQWTPFRHHPFVPANFCDAQNPTECGPFCPCDTGSACDSTLECRAGLTCVVGTCRDCANGGCQGAPCSPSNSCVAGLSCADGVCRPLCETHPDAPGCVAAHCANGVRDQAESDVDCGGDCPGCGPGDVCGGDADCNNGQACGTNNGAYFDKPRAARVCWPQACTDGVDPTECGQPDRQCGIHCGGAKPCTPGDLNSTCPAGEVCKAGWGQLFDVDAPGVCVDPSCPSNDPTKCGTEASLCGKECVCTPDCSGATAANPSDGCDGVCPHICPDGQPCCSLDLHCSVGSTCQAQASGSGVCRPGGCAFQVLAPPLCGSPSAPCGAQCPACTPECGGRQCGVDPACGTSCGTCGAELYCTWEGQCAPGGGSREPVQVPNGTGGVVPLPDLPEGPTSAVGAVAGQFSVSDQGTAQYNVPIDVPPGRAGVEPALSLRYSATRASGEAGVGWKLEGLSQITRCPRVYALDGYSAPVANNATDRFCIDGKRLETIAGSAQYGTEGAEYRTLIDTFTKVISHVDQGEGHQHAPLAGILRLIRDQQGPDYFMVSMKDGRILTYGRTRDSLLMGQNGVRVSWLLNKVEDRAGNTMKVRYTNLRASLPAEGADGVPNLVKPEAISYTGHGEVDGTREVRFDYERRLDGQLSFAQGGTPLIVTHRLHRVMTFADRVPVKNYRLEYADETHSQLTKVFECIRDADEKCKAPTEFAYEKESGFTQAENGPSIAGAGQLDVNGDGLTDFLVTTARAGDMPANTGLKAGFITADVAIGVGTYVYLTPVGGLAVSAVWGLLKGPLYGMLADKPKVTFTTDLLKGMGSRAHPVDDVANVSGLRCPTAVSFFADYDQDGRDDVISLCSPDALSVFRSLGDGNFGSFPSSEPVATLPGQTPPFTLPVVPPPLLYDVNGDSLQDVVSCSDPSTLEVRLRQSPGEAFQSAIVLRGALGWPGQGGIRARLPYCADAVPTYQILDVDGDGTPELVARFGATGMEKVQVGAKSGWFALRLAPPGASPRLGWQLINFPDTGKSSQGENMLVADLNGDGLNDVWRPDGAEATIWLNTGGRFLARTIPRPRPAFFPGTRLAYSAIADYNSDGRLDILEHWTDTKCTKPNAPADCFEEQFNVALRPDPVVSFLEAGLAPDLTWRSTSTTTVSAGVFSTVGDLDGDGNADLFGRNGQVFFGSGLHNMLLSSVKDGLGNVIHVRYDANLPYKATCSEGTQWPERCLKTMKGLVSGHSEGFTDPSGFNGEVIERNYSYAYENARMNVTGHGWLGFDRRSVTETVQGQGRTVTTEFQPVARYTPAGTATTSTAPPYLYPLAGLPRSVIIDQGPTLGGDVTQSPLEDAPHSRRTRITNFWRVQSSADSRPFPVLNRARTETFSRRVPAPFNDVPFAEDGVQRTSCTNLNEDVDGYGNVGFNQTYCEAPELEARIERVTTETTFQPNRTKWLISNPELITVTGRRDRTASSSDSQTQVVDPEYDILGFLHAITRDPSGERQRSTYTRDDFGNVTRIVEDVGTGEAARITNLTYDADNIFPRTVTNAKGHTSQLSFDSKYGQVATVVDPNGIATQRSYDAFGKVSETRGPGGTSVFDYASLLATSLQTEAGTSYPRLQLTVVSTGVEGSTGGRSQQQFDNYGRVVRSETVGFNGAAVISEQAYDARGRVVGATLPHLAGVLAPSTAYQYDYLDRVTQVKHSDGTFSERQYASGVSLAQGYQKWLGGLSCRVPTLTRCAVDIELSVDTHAPGEAGKQNVVIKDHAGLVVRSIDGENVDTVARTSNYDYAAFNRLQQLRDNANAVTVFNHDPYGRLKVHVDPDAGVTQYTYNGFGEVSTSLDPKQQLRTYKYDTLGRLETIVDSAGTTRWVYDQGVSALGQLSESISPATLENPAGQHVLYSYEAATPTRHRGLVQTITYAIDNAAYAIGMHYDDLARIDTVDYPNTGSGAPIRAKYNYDATSGALIGLAEIGSGTPRPVWRIDAAFQGHLVEQETFGNGAVSSLSYDPDRRWLDSIRTKLGTETIQSLDYSYYDNGQVHERLSPGLDQEYAYDPLGRLRTITEARSGFPTALKEFRYDYYGNLTQKHGVTNVYSTNPHLPDTVGGNTYTHDANGNLKSRVGPDVPGGTQTIQYTPFDLPKEVVTGTGTTRTTQFDYTADGTRVVRRDATTTQHFASSLYHRVLSTSGGSTLEEHFRLFAGAGAVAEIVRKPGSETTLYFHPDHLGTPDTISDGNLNVTHQEYGPFGDLVGVPPSINGNSTRVGFTGHQQDNDIGFTDMGGRVYDSLAGRFTTADPIMQAPFWSQGQNRYAYVFNDPINATDPSGFITTGTTGGDIATAGAVGAGWGTLGYGIATELGASIGSISPAGSLGGSVGTTGLGILHTMLLTPGGPPANTSYSVAAPSGAPTSSLNKVNGMGSAPGAAQPPGPPAPLGSLPDGEGLCAEFEDCLAQDAGTPSTGAEGAPNSGNSRAYNNGRGERAGLEVASSLLPVGPGIKLLSKLKWVRWLLKLRAARAAAALAPKLRFTATTAQHMTEAGRFVPRHTLADAILYGRRMADPEGAKGAIKIVQEIWVNKKPYTLEIIYREADNTILHFLYK